MVHTSQVPNRLRQSPLWLTTTICNGLPVKAGISIFTSYPQEHPSIKDYSKGPDKHGATGTCSVSKVKVSRSAIKNHKQLHRAICFLLEMIPDCPIPVKRGGLGEKGLPWIWTPLQDTRTTTPPKFSLQTCSIDQEKQDRTHLLLNIGKRNSPAPSPEVSLGSWDTAPFQELLHSWRSEGAAWLFVSSELLGKFPDKLA